MEKKRENPGQDGTPEAGYSPVPRPRRGNRRATGGSSIGGREPHLAGLEAPYGQRSPEEDEMAVWLKEQRPPHYE